MREIAEFVAVLSCSLFAGASVYINLVEHPARMECGVEIAATEFAPSYRRATIMQASSAALGLLSSVAAWLAGATFWCAGCWSPSGQRYPVYTARDLAPPISCCSAQRWIGGQSKRSVCSHAGTRGTPCAVCSAEWHCWYCCTWRSSRSLWKDVLIGLCPQGCFGFSRSRALLSHGDQRT